MFFGKRSISVAAVLLLCAPGVRCFASPMQFNAVLSGSQENPATGSPAIGTALLTLDGNLLTVLESFSGLTAPAAAGHIHCCAAVGANAAVVIPFSPFPNATSGTYMQTFDLSTFSFGGGINEATFLSGLESGLAYVNIHDANFPSGEIRGQLTAATPEPSSLLLLGTGLVGLTAMARRRLRI